MKYLVLIWSNPTTWGHPVFLRTPEAATMPPEEVETMRAQFEELMAEISASGELVAAHALADPSTSRAVRVRDGVPVVTDGPYVEAKEQMAGAFVIDCETPERAEQIAARFPDARFAAVELRPMMGSSGDEM